MPRALHTGSSRARVRICPPSAALPGVKTTGPDKVGNVIHEHMALRATHGVDFAVEAIPGLCDRWLLTGDDAGIARARCMSFEYAPPKGAIPEVALALFDDGSVRRVEGARGSYDLPEGGIFAATIDLLWAENAQGKPIPFAWEGDRPVCPPGGIVWAMDYKTGAEKNVESIEQNAQLQAAALLAARWTGARLVAPAVLLVRKGKGIWDVPAAYLGPVQFDQIEREIRAEHAAIAAAAQALAAGTLREGFVTGAHCEYCPAATRCPAKTSGLLALLGEVAPAGDAPLTTDHLRRLLPLVGQLEQAANAIKAAAKRQVEATGQPIDLGDGKVWGPHLAAKKTLDVGIALPLLVEEVGADLARTALNATLSRDRIKAAYLAHLGGEDAEPGAAERGVRGFFGRAIAAGAQKSAGEIWWSAYRPKPGGAAGDEEPLQDDDDEEPRQRKKAAPRGKKMEQADLFLPAGPPAPSPGVTAHGAQRYQERVNPGASPEDAAASVQAAAARAPAPDAEGRTQDPETGLRLAIGPGPSGTPTVVTVLGGPMRIPLGELAGSPPPAPSPAAAPAPSKGLARGAPLLPRSTAPASPAPPGRLLPGRPLSSS